MMELGTERSAGGLMGIRRRAACSVLVAALAVATRLPAGDAARSPATGRIHGTVVTHAGTRATGLIRWGGQEAFWDDLFQSAKLDLPYPAYAEREPEPVEAEWWWQELGRRLVEAVEAEPDRVFTARFGDIAKLEPAGGNAAVVTMRSGTAYRVSGHADDVGATLTVVDEAGGETEIEWGRIDVVELSAAPPGATFAGHRLYGTVDAGALRLTGFIQWDRDEALSSDRLDGDTGDGRASIPFATIRAIEKMSARSARVTLADGRALVLEGTNDVDGRNRGILVEDPRYGRVEVPWAAFVRVQLARPDGSGPSCADFPAPRRLRGAVTTGDGARHAGALHVDLDAAESWELLEGSGGGIRYQIPFSRVASLERDASVVTVTLVRGEGLLLDDGPAAGPQPVGVVVVGDDGVETFVPWREVRRIDLAW